MEFLTKKNILIISPESWGKSYLSKHLYALELVKAGNEVWFLNAPHFVTENLSSQETEQTFGKLHLLNERSLRGLRFFPFRMRRWLIDRMFERLEMKAGIEFDIIWSFDNSRYFSFENSNAFAIHHVVDLHMDFHLREACSTADLCLGVTDEIVNRMSAFNSNSHLIQHAWKEPRAIITDIQLNSNRLKIAYMGNLAMKAFDVELLLELVMIHPECDFVLIGSNEVNHLTGDVSSERIELLNKLKTFTNVVFTGELEYDAAQSVLVQCDIMLLMYFNFERTFDNSSKIMCYLAAGKVVVSNYVSAYKDSDLLCMAHARGEFKSLLAEVIQSPDEYNSPTLMEKRQAFARINSYAERLKQIEHLIIQTLRNE